MGTELDWPGWLIKENPYGEEFDVSARRRMLEGSRKLEPLLTKYRDQFGTNLLEVGPFFIPLLTHAKYSDAKITYWDNDEFAATWLSNNGAHAVLIDIERISHLPVGESFDSVVVSQTLNYVSYKPFLCALRYHLRSGGLVFINNVVDYGLPTLFSEGRPKSIKETLGAMSECGYEVIEHVVLPSEDLESQKEPRLLLVARNTSKD